MGIQKRKWAESGEMDAPLNVSKDLQQNCDQFDPPLDPGIEPLVRCLVSRGIETFESCEGGPGHAYPEPTVRFHGGKAEGYKAAGYALEAGFGVSALRRVWPVLDSELTGPYWELTLIALVG
jgi:hypothetical protein